MSDLQKEKHIAFSKCHIPAQNDSKSVTKKERKPDFPVFHHDPQNSANPKFPFNNWQHYIDPGVEVKKPRRIGFIAQQSMCESHNLDDDLRSPTSPNLPTSHPWFSCSSPPKH